MLDAVRWTCATCYRPEKVRVGSLCWDCWSVLHRAPVAALRVVKARPPRHPLRPLLACCWHCGESDPARGCHICYTPAAEPARALPAAVQAMPMPVAA